MIQLSQRSVTEIPGVGAALQAKLERLGIATWQDLLFHLPIRYEDRTRLMPVGSLQPYRTGLLEAEVLAAQVAFGRRRSLVVKVSDRTGMITLRFFHFNNAQKSGFVPGRKLRLYGEARPGAAGLEIYHPEYSFIDKGAPPLEETLTPVYPTTEGLTQKRLRGLVDRALDEMAEQNLPDLIPSEFRLDGGASLADSLRELHRPPPGLSAQALEAGERPGQIALAYEELLAHQVSLQKLRDESRDEMAPVIESRPEVEQRLRAQLHFDPTGAQIRVAADIYRDLASEQPMMRLLQGDVGSGKTLVAAMAAIQVISAGYQAALMVPTEILAEQHMRNFGSWFSALGYRVLSLTGKHKGKAREAILEMIASGQADLVVGTHALFQEDVHYANLGLVVIDEQHRFGVGQRFALNRKAEASGSARRAHQLVMTATPIPRTLAMSHYSNLDLSVIDEFPKGRKPVQTALVSRDRRDEVIESIRVACGEGRQVYWVCTLIEESENFDLQAAELAAEELRLALPELQIGLLHGRMKPNEKDQVMNSFRAREIQLLVSTTVIEVGVDVPNASLMIIENPERLGLAQLHQLRGRVGRGEAESHCILLYGTPLSNAARERLRAMRETRDGFELAEIDLRMRGPGELLGARQTGEAGYRIADLMRDRELLSKASAVAPDYLHANPGLADLLIERWFHRAEDFATV